MIRGARNQPARPWNISRRKHERGEQKLTKVVVGCFGDADSLEIVRQLASSAEVVAVAFDLGGAVPLRDLSEAARAAGASRCHALDVREEFARESLLPALRSGTIQDPQRAFATLAPPYVTRKLQELAAIEQAVCLPPDVIELPLRALVKAAVAPIHLDIRFVDGVPVSINGVDMTLTELMESIETITGEPALDVLQRA